jgi:hypothetical protein
VSFAQHLNLNYEKAAPREAIVQRCSFSRGASARLRVSPATIFGIRESDERQIAQRSGDQQPALA